MKTPRILFSTTKNFNPGDEVILMGIERLLATSNIHYEKLIYDRNPSNKQQRKEALTNITSNIPDYIIFAGTPEWCSEFPNITDLINGPYTARFFSRSLRLRQTDRSNDPLLSYILKQQIHCAMLGVGSSKPPTPTHKIKRILNELADVFVVRDPQTQDCFSDFKSQLAPCPALFCSDTTTPRSHLNKIGITLQAPHTNLIQMDKSGFDYAINCFRDIVKYYKNHVEMICHTTKDADYFRVIFPDVIINTLTDGASLVEIYSHYDAILSTRLHGCVAACSLGIPTFQLWHGLRMSTLKQIPVDNQCGGESALNWLQNLDINKRSTQILDIKQNAMASYLKSIAPLKQYLMNIT